MSKRTASDRNRHFVWDSNLRLHFINDATVVDLLQFRYQINDVTGGHVTWEAAAEPMKTRVVLPYVHAAFTSNTGASPALTGESTSVSVGRRGRRLLVAHRSRPTHTQSCGVLPVPTYDLKSLSAHDVHAATCSGIVERASLITRSMHRLRRRSTAWWTTRETQRKLFVRR